ncbi:MAG: 2-methylcitrate dehydratase PrpD [Gammaproteobacteria bacterium]|jgi:2-methylcitrate dehydratase PrpD
MKTFAASEFSEFVTSVRDDQIPSAARRAVENSFLDISGLCVAARGTDYIAAVRAGWDGEGYCTAFGHARTSDAAGAALINGTAAHGEDYDDTYEGQPVHTGAVVIPAVFAACERYELGGADALRGCVVGMELMCRTALIAPTAIHKAGFHPTAVIGTLGATAGVGVALKLNASQLTQALGIAGSMASGIIEYLAEGTWPKRLHPGWSAQCGLRAALLAQHGFTGPRSVLEGEHGFFKAFAIAEVERDYSQITKDLGQTWLMSDIAFKPYACGTMTQPYIDCAINLSRKGIKLDDIETIVCKVGEGTVHRLWEQAEEKKRPTTPYSAKFSGPFCIAAGLVDQAAGLEQFTQTKIDDPKITNLAAKVRYEIDPDNEYPRNYSGHIHATMRDGTMHEVHQPHLRGGVREPLSRDELAKKFEANLTFAGCSSDDKRTLRACCDTIFDAPNMKGLKAFRQ